ncbi:transmembrane protein UsgS [Rhizodiscina lignyota]|uniref:Transmembrane protein UsgS n=1 Tax=Rhizodiscina lignyota TaxID=1504668 RepID=A0A9P4M908_9PEZI|nr:transmembrane protein UsgS [Rhizodiscina lignyota]
MSNFDPNAIIRGAQLTLVGAHRALQNPKLFTSDHYRQAAIAVAAGLAIRLIIAIPTIGVRVFIWILGFFVNLEGSQWDNELIDGLTFIEHSVLQVPFLLMSLMRYLTPTMDRMFMDSLDWVDRTYIAKHRGEDPRQLRAMYYENLRLYPTHGDPREGKGKRDAIIAFLIRYGRRAGISLAIYALSHVPVVGRFVLPAASFYTFHAAVGTQPAVIIFGTAIFLPRRYLVTFLQSYFSSRSLMRELLDPYFSRVRYTREQKKLWFRDREGVLFGFAVGFFVFLKIPLLGVLIYGIAEASTAFLLTKITDPPPPPSQAKEYAEGQVRWQNKHEFLNLSLENLDALNIRSNSTGNDPTKTEEPFNKFS